MKDRLNKDKILENTLTILCIISLFFIIIGGSFSLMMYYKGFYLSEYQKNGVYDDLAERNQITQQEAMIYANNVTDNIFDYFHSKSELNYFENDEKAHMKDVKAVISAVFFIYYSSAMLFIVCFVILFLKFKNDSIGFIKFLSKILLIGSIATLGLLIIILLMNIFYFNLIFNVFHQLFFPQGNWIFESTSLLITLFPQQFFFDITLRIFIYSIVQAAIFLLMGWWMHKQIKLHEHYEHIKKGIKK